MNDEADRLMFISKKEYDSAKLRYFNFGLFTGGTITFLICLLIGYLVE